MSIFDRAGLADKDRTVGTTTKTQTISFYRDDGDDGGTIQDRMIDPVVPVLSL